MVREDNKILRYIDWGIYMIFIPIILVLIPTNRIAEIDPYFFILMMFYMVVIHAINRRFNFITYLFKKEYQRAALVIIAIVVITYLASLIRPGDATSESSSFVTQRQFRGRVLSTLCFMDLSFTVMLGLLMELFRQRIERQEIEAEKGKAELAIYKSQINPHFMFNTLNTIYALNFTHSDQTGEVIMKFSNIVKYIYQNSDKERIMIVDEVKYLKEFIDIHALRLSEHTKVNFHSEIDDDSQEVPSMIFITFVENVFKYGVSSSEASDIDISLRLKYRELTFTTSNRIFMRDPDSTGIGIENCRKRLSLLYADRYTLECCEVGDMFNVTLKIEL